MWDKSLPSVPLGRRVWYHRATRFAAVLIAFVTAVAVYEYLLCFSTEVKLIWGGSRGIFSLSTLLYLGCRMAVFFSCAVIWLPEKAGPVSGHVVIFEVILT